MVVLLLTLFVVGTLIEWLGQRMLNHWDVDQPNHVSHDTTHHHRT